MGGHHSHAVPLRACGGNDRWHVGTGFLIDTPRGLALTTAAHVPTGVNVTSPGFVWPRELLAEYRGGSISFELLGGSGEHRFAIRHQPRMPNIDDMMMLHGPHHAAGLAELQQHYSAYVTDFSTAQPDPGTIVAAHGYPGEYWVPPIKIATGPITMHSDTGDVLAASFDGEPGMSGGPVTLTDGELVGMYFSHNDATATVPAHHRIVTLQALATIAP